MIKRLLIAFVALVISNAMAHQFTPTYPKFEPSFMSGVSVTSMMLFNKRADVSFYEIEVFNETWNPIPFATDSKIINIQYLQTKRIDVYVKDGNVKDVMYICSQSKLKKENITATLINSKICSKVK